MDKERNLIWEAYDQVNEEFRDEDHYAKEPARAAAREWWKNTFLESLPKWPDGSGRSRDVDPPISDISPEEENTERSKQLAEEHFYEIDELIKAELVSRGIKEHQKQSFVVFNWGKLLGDKLAENADMDVVAYWRAMTPLITAGYGQAVYIDVTNALKPQIDELR